MREHGKISKAIYLRPDPRHGLCPQVALEPLHAPHLCGGGDGVGKSECPLHPAQRPLFSGYPVLMHLDAPPLGTPPHLPVFVLCVVRHVA